MKHQNNDVRRLIAYGRTIKAVYAGVNVVWQAVRSCFSAGYWDNNKPFINEEQWRNR